MSHDRIVAFTITLVRAVTNASDGPDHDHRPRVHTHTDISICTTWLVNGLTCSDRKIIKQISVKREINLIINQILCHITSGAVIRMRLMVEIVLACSPRRFVITDSCERWAWVGHSRAVLNYLNWTNQKHISNKQFDCYILVENIFFILIIVYKTKHLIYAELWCIFDIIWVEWLNLCNFWLLNWEKKWEKCHKKGNIMYFSNLP